MTEGCLPLCLPRRGIPARAIPGDPGKLPNRSAQSPAGNLPGGPERTDGKDERVAAMKRMLAALIALLFAFSFYAPAEEEIGGEGIINFSDGEAVDSLIESGDLSLTDPFMPDSLEKAVDREDDRITVKSPKQYPYSAIAYMKVKGACGCNWECTGFLVSNKVLLTAAHCLVCYTHHEWAKNITFYFGYKSKKNYLSKYDSTWTAWVGAGPDKSSALSTEDWGIVKLNKNVGKKTGYFGMKLITGSDPVETVFYFAGYRDGKLKYDTGTVGTLLNDELFAFQAYIVHGNSGGPIYDKDCYATGIITSQDELANWGHRITPQMRQKMIDNDLLH